MVAAYLFNSAKSWGKYLTGVEFQRRLRILGIHVHHKVSIRREERHLAFGITTIGTMRVRLNEFSDRETVRGFARGNCRALAHENCSLVSGMIFFWNKTLCALADLLQYDLEPLQILRRDVLKDTSDQCGMSVKKRQEHLSSFFSQGDGPNPPIGAALCPVDKPLLIKTIHGHAN
jgi:hypothetical protein